MRCCATFARRRTSCRSSSSVPEILSKTVSPSRCRRRRLYGQAVRACRAFGAAAGSASTGKTARDVLRVADLELDSSGGSSSRRAANRSERAKEHALLEFLMRTAAGRSRVTIIEHVWNIQLQQQQQRGRGAHQRAREKVDAASCTDPHGRGVGYMLSDGRVRRSVAARVLATSLPVRVCW